jgi:dihydrofolate reductase
MDQPLAEVPPPEEGKKKRVAEDQDHSEESTSKAGKQGSEARPENKKKNQENETDEEPIEVGGTRPSIAIRSANIMKLKASAYIATSVDGFIATPTGDISFLEGFEGDLGGFATFLASVDVLIMGRKSFDKVVSFGSDLWAYGDTRVIVWSRGKADIPVYLQTTVSCSSLSPKDLISQLEQAGYKRAYVDGGETIQRFLQDGLIDEIQLTRIPVLLGAGIPLFSNTGRKLNLKHLTTNAYSNGMVMTSYRVLNNDQTT